MWCNCFPLISPILNKKQNTVVLSLSLPFCRSSHHFSLSHITNGESVVLTVTTFPYFRAKLRRGDEERQQFEEKRRFGVLSSSLFSYTLEILLEVDIKFPFFDPFLESFLLLDLYLRSGYTQCLWNRQWVFFCYRQNLCFFHFYLS